METVLASRVYMPWLYRYGVDLAYGSNTVTVAGSTPEGADRKARFCAFRLAPDARILFDRDWNAAIASAEVEA